MSMTLIQGIGPVFIKRPAALLLVLCAFAMTACVSNVSSQVKESNKDSAGAFNGVWVANVQKSARRQPMPGKWIANCDGSPWTFTVRVKDGVARSNLRESKEPTFVSSNGDFRFDIPLAGEARSSAGSERDISLAKRTMIIYGNLQKAEGRITFAIAEFGNGGCTAKIEFSKAGA